MSAKVPSTLSEAATKALLAEQMLAQTEAAAAFRIRAAIDAGEALERAKESMEHGQWIPWIEATLGGITRRTVAKWIKLADFHRKNGDAIFDDVTSLRQAYKLAGIIPEVSSAGANRNRETVDYVLHQGRFDLALDKLMPEKMTNDELEAFGVRWARTVAKAMRIMGYVERAAHSHK